MNHRIFLGVDAGSQTHFCCAVNEKTETVWTQSVSNDHSGCNRILHQLQSWQNEGMDIWIAGEGQGGYLSPLDVQLMKAGYRYVSVSPLQVNRYRQMMGLPPDKDDEKDARHLAELLQWSVVHKRVVHTPVREEEYEEIKEAARGLTQLVHNKVDVQNQLTSWVRQYWPELVVTERFFARTDARGFLALLAAYPTPDAVAHAGQHRVSQLLQRAMGNRRQEDLAAAVMEQAQRLRSQVQVSPSRALLVQQLASNLLTLLPVIQQAEDDLAALLNRHPFGRWMLAQQGIGVRIAGCFLGEAGNLDRFDTESQLARYAGNGAVKQQSGVQPAQYRDQRCYNHRLKRVMILMANSRSQHHAESHEFVSLRKQQGTPHWKASKKLSRHLIRFLWKGWKQTMSESSSGVSLPDSL